TTKPVSWGYRDQSSSKTYIAIPGTLWAGGGNTHAQTLSAYEGSVLSQFVLKTGAWGSTYPLPGISSANPDASWATVLASLTHELGHVKFAYIIHPDDLNGHKTNGRNYKLDALTSCKLGDGTNLDFFGGWDYKDNAGVGNKKKLVPKDMWRPFG